MSVTEAPEAIREGDAGERVLRVVQEAMGKAGYVGKAAYPLFADRIGIDVRTLRSVGVKTTVETLEKIANGSRGELVIRIEPRKTP